MQLIHVEGYGKTGWNAFVRLCCDAPYLLQCYDYANPKGKYTLAEMIAWHGAEGRQGMGLDLPETTLTAWVDSENLVTINEYIQRIKFR